MRIPSLLHSALALLLLLLAFPSISANGGSSSPPSAYHLRGQCTPGYNLSWSSNPINLAGLAVDLDGNVWLSDCGGNRLVCHYGNNGSVKSIVKAGFNNPQGLDCDNQGNVWVADSGNGRVCKLSANGNLLGSFSGFTKPTGVSVDGFGNVYVTDNMGSGQGKVAILSSFGILLWTFTGLSNPWGIALDGSGFSWVPWLGSVSSFGLDLSFQSKLSYNFNPLGITFDGWGNLVLAGNDSSQVLVLNSDNSVKTRIAPPPGSFSSSGCVFDLLGNLWVSDLHTNSLCCFGPGPAPSSTAPRSVSSSTFSSSAFSSSRFSSSGPASSSLVPLSSLVASSTAAASSSVVSSSSRLPSSTAAASSSLLRSSTASALSSSAIPSSTSVGMAYADPRFLGFWGQDMFVGGMAGAVYSLLSDSAVLLNARFVQLAGEDIHCPAVVQMPCSPHSGTYFGAIGVRSSNEDRLTIAAGRDGHGFESVQLNGVELLAGGVVTHHQVSSPSALQRLRGGDRASPSSFAIHAQLLSNRTLQVSVGMYELRVDNLDHYLDLVSVNVTCWQCLLEQVQPEGLLGRTWDRHVQHSVDEQVVDEYRERDGDLLGCNTPHDRTCSAAQHAKKLQ